MQSAIAQPSRLVSLYLEGHGYWPGSVSSFSHRAMRLCAGDLLSLTKQHVTL